MHTNYADRPLLPQVRAFTAAPKQFLIGGAWTVDGAEGAFLVNDPVTGSELSQVPVAGRRAVDAAVLASKAALEGAWGRESGRQRAALMHRLADLINENAEALAQLESLNTGKPLTQGRADVAAAGEHLRYFAGWADKLEGRTIPVAENRLVYTLKEPAGVAALIVPWNFPLLISVWKLAPALATGNAAILKPAEQTPLTALKLAELIVEAGFPPGSVNVLTGPGDVTGALLASHPGIEKISFTGSTAVGRKIQIAAAGSLKRLSLELGGNSPHIIFADADIERASEAALWGAFYNCGQQCSAGSRLYVQRAAFEEVLERVKEGTRALTVGDGLLDPDVGPLISEAQLQRVLRLLRAAAAGPGELVLGGERLGGELSSGYFLAPTLLTHEEDSLEVVREEVFGPVLSVSAFDHPSEAIARANATRYGLTAALWTRDIALAHGAAAQLRAGTVWINSYDQFDPAAPFGGYKESGYGREMGREALDLYTETKTVWVDLEGR